MTTLLNAAEPTALSEIMPAAQPRQTRCAPRPQERWWAAMAADREAVWGRLTTAPFLIGGDGNGHKMGLRLLLDWPTEQSGATWQDRWAATGADPRPRIFLLHSTGNSASCRVAHAAGFPMEGTLRGYLLHADGWHDVHSHARLSTDRSSASTPSRDPRATH
ncbi:GNAT family N-acetyltransferase [Cryptosporangium sp. NPDC048952]|uniref:GNAT family N-acetyltransferase n=1 Tax=Cryptosporangium sp. NPDC048952 TaxID=3363961 RepID=UPI00371A8A15